jgi:hypothetical protein
MTKDEDWPGNIVYLINEPDPAPPYFSSATGELDVEGCYFKSIDHVRIDLGETLGSIDVTPGPPGGSGGACPTAGDSYSTEVYGGGNNEVTGGTAALTQTNIRAPASAQPGERLQFQVTLVATPSSSLAQFPPTSQPMTLKPCPHYYDEIEGIAGTFRVASLNCAFAKPIPPDGSETFDMYIDIPRAAKPGPATIIWDIVGSPRMYEEATSYLAIT